MHSVGVKFIANLEILLSSLVSASLVHYVCYVAC